MSAYKKWATANPELARETHEAFKAGMTKAASVCRCLRTKESPVRDYYLDKCIAAIKRERDKP